jgi:hypothetical protein
MTLPLRLKQFEGPRKRELALTSPKVRLEFSNLSEEVNFLDIANQPGDY